MSAPTSTAIQEISIAHSPDSDDAFMFYGLATNKVRVPGYKFTHTLTDIETLNQRAINEAFYDVTAISFHAYPYLQDNYTLMACGGSVGEGYGPMIVSSRKLTLDCRSRRRRIAVPGTLTTAYLTLKLFAPEIETAVVPFDKIIPAVVAGEYRRRPHHPRGPAYLCQRWPGKAARSRPVVARADWPAAASGRQCHPPLARRGDAADDDQRAARQHPARARQPRRSARLRDAVRARSRSHRSPIASSACTSTSAR